MAAEAGSTQGFVHLHVHSYYSFLDSTLAPEEIVRLAVEEGAEAVSLTDTNSLSGAVAFYRMAREAGLTPVLGAEVRRPLERERALLRERASVGGCPPALEQVWEDPSERWTGEFAQAELAGPAGPAERESGGSASPVLCHGDPERRVVLLARSLAGYSEISRILTRRMLDPEFDLLVEVLNLSDQVVAFSDSPEVVEALAWAGRPGLRYAALVPSRLRRQRNRMIYEQAVRLGLPLVAVCDVKLASPSDAPLHTILQAMRRLVTVHHVREEERIDPAQHFQSAGAVHRFFGLKENDSLHPWHGRPARDTGPDESDLPPGAPASVPADSRAGASVRRFGPAVFPSPCAGRDAGAPGKSLNSTGETPVPQNDAPFRQQADSAPELRAALAEAVANTIRIAELCRFELPLGEWKFPRFEGIGEPPARALAELVAEGLRERYGEPVPEAARTRAEHELEVISQLQFTDYFLLVHRIVAEARSRGFFTLGRGSAANSIVTYALGISNVCPILHNLYFERFLNPERSVPPDIDLDFSWKERDTILEWCFEFFGQERVALISTIQTFRSRQAIREVAKVHGLSEREVNAFTRLSETGFRVEEETDGSLQPRRSGARVHDLSKSEPWRTVVAQAERLRGFPRHLSVHCGGIVITPGPVTDWMPLARSAKGYAVTQMDMYGVEELGLIKIDLLGNRSLGVLKDAIRMAEANESLERRKHSAADERG